MDHAIIKELWIKAKHKYKEVHNKYDFKKEKMEKSQN